ncbi:alpha N-terminal protein methyltransferase 1-like [Colias croceus]|uniref:alpha N-terminal protein methyltransferase 1-like n=1 Tax=Colias crocea TaxID=72248 RepID=UPI001E27FFE3|nr:alpha N-terminal protein methyltransferase 1-like [Colias croceus]
MSKRINYEKALEYWSEIPATVDGVLGGFGFISDIDIVGSTQFLQSLFSLENSPGREVALDCGAGIGRITKHLLLPHFNKVDVIEPDQKFLNEILNYVGENSSNVGKLYHTSLQDFQPERKYDVIWNQWVLGYLKDEDLVSYLITCRNTLAENGVIVVKENITSSGKTEADDADSSVTRCLKQYTKIFKQAKLKRVKQCKQTNFPNGIYPVYMFALIPVKDHVSENKHENDLL